MSGSEMQGIGQIDQNKLSAVPAYGADDMSDPLGMPAQASKFDPARLQAMMALRGLMPQQQQMPMPQGMPAPQIQPGGLMGAMPQMPQGGYRPRGMAGRF